MATEKISFSKFYQNVYHDMFVFGGTADVTENADGKVQVVVAYDNSKVSFPTMGWQFKEFLKVFVKGMEDVKKLYGKSLIYEDAFKKAVNETSELSEWSANWNTFLEIYGRCLAEEYNK